MIVGDVFWNVIIYSVLGFLAYMVCLGIIGFYLVKQGVKHLDKDINDYADLSETERTEIKEYVSDLTSAKILNVILKIIILLSGPLTWGIVIRGRLIRSDEKAST